MASLPTGSDRLLDIRTAKVDTVIRLKGKQKQSIIKNDTPSSSLQIAGEDIERISIPLQEITVEYGDHKGDAIYERAVIPMFFEQTDYIVTVRARDGEHLEFQCNSPLIEERVGRVIDDDPTLLSGVVNFDNNVGFSDFTVLADGKRILTIRLEVYPSKITYKEDYQNMMADINAMISECVLDFMKKTYQVFVPDHKHNDIPAVFFTILQTIYDQFLQSVNRIIAVPHHKLISEYETVPFYKAKRTDTRSVKWLINHPEYLKKNDQTILAEKVLTVKKRITYDTQENRIVKHMLRMVIRRINDFKKRYAASPAYFQEIVSKAEKMERELQRIIATSFLAEVSEFSTTQSMSLVFGMAPGYRELYKYYLMLQNGFTVGGDVFRMSVRETAALYEYWCFIKLYVILKERYELKSPDIIKVDKKGVTVELAKGKNSEVKFVNTKTHEEITLTYNQSERKTQTVNQKPDNILELEKQGSNHSYQYVFDAKYRIESNPDGNFYPDTNPGPKVDDINTMHRYRDSIVFENKESRFTFEKSMFGAYILFPYSNEDEYRNHRFYRSIDKVNIGGLPFLPGATALVTQLLDELILDSADVAFERASLPAGIDEHIPALDWSRRDVLIGSLSDKANLDIIQGDKPFYYTKKKNIGAERFPLRYVAIYQSKELFEGKAGIELYGEIKSYKLVQRKDIKEIPYTHGNPTEEYYRFEIVKWKKLNKKIVVRDSSLRSVRYTNLFLLEHCEYTDELYLRSEEEYRFYRAVVRKFGNGPEKDALTEDTKDNGTNRFVVAGKTYWFEDDELMTVEADGTQTGVELKNDIHRKPGKVIRELLG